MIRPKRLALTILVLWAAGFISVYSRTFPASTPRPEAGFAAWTFQEDFRDGIPGWMSFPLSQDVGYDPTIYTAQAGGARVLVRDVTSYGQQLLRAGLVRPLSFHADPSSSFRIAYNLEACGQTQDFRVTLGSKDGKQYSRSLSGQSGPHDSQVVGRELNLPVAGADIEVIVLEAVFAAPPLGCHSRLTLRSLEIQARKPAGILIRAPDLEHSAVDDLAVAQEVVSAGNPLRIELGGGSAARLAVYNDANELIQTADLPAGQVRETHIPAPAKPGLYRLEVTSAAATSGFYFLVLNGAPTHPRVLLNSERLEQLRSGPYSQELLAAVHRRANDLRHVLAYNPDAGQSIALLPVVSVHPGLPAYFALMENYGNAIAFNALEFRLTGDLQLLEAARRALLAVAAWSTWTPPWFDAHGLHTYYEVGVFTQRLAFGYDLVASELSTEDRGKIAEALWKNSVRPTLEDYFAHDRLPIAASNHEAQSVGGAIEACVALYGDVTGWELRFGPALAKLILVYERLQDGLFPGDGSEAEPSTYAHFTMEGMSWGMAALKALDIRTNGFERMREAFWWLRYAEVRPDLVLDTGDSGTELKVLSGFAWGAEYGDNPALRAFYDTATDKSLSGTFGARRVAGTGEPDPPGLLDLVCCTRSSEAIPEPPFSRIFPARGSAVMRGGWRPEDTVVTVRAGPWFNHEHHDQGSFLVSALGEQLVAEAGGTSYYTDPHYLDFFTQPPAHNTVVVDHDAFSQEDYDGRYWPAFQHFAKFDRHVFSPGIDYLSADLTAAYRDSSQIRGLQRDYLFIKPVMLIIRDDIQADVPHVYSWFVHVPNGAQSGVTPTSALIRGKAAYAVLTAAGQNVQWRKQAQPVPIHAYADLDRTPVTPREAFRLDSPQQKSAQFLVAMHFQTAAEAEAPLQPFQNASADGFRTRDASGSTTVLFRRNGGPLTVEDIAADGSSMVVVKRADVEELFAAQVRSLHRGQQTLMSASDPIEVVFVDQPSSTDLYVTCASATELRLFPKKKPVAVSVDQAPIAAGAAEGVITLAHLAKGEHVLRISY